MTELDGGRIGLLSKGAKQPVTRSQSSIDGAEPDQQHYPTNRLNVEHI